MIWLLFCIGLIPLIFLPRVVFNAFSLPQIFALGILSSLGVVLGVVNGLVSLAAPSILAIFFLTYITLTLTWTQPIHNGIKELGLQASLIFLFVIGCTYINISNAGIITLAIAIASALCSLYSYGQTKGIDWFFPNNIKKGGKITNAIGSVGNPNFLSAYLLSSFWLGVYTCLTIHPFLVILPIFCGIGLYLTKSRAGLTGIVSSLMFFVIVAGFFGYYPAGLIVANTLLSITIIGIGLAAWLLYKNWDFFWNSDIDPQGEQVWFATLRYRFCYWLAAWELIKQKPIFGWGMWSYRREVYGAQAKLNEKNPNFLRPTRYITPQPRECHNDYLEHLVEFGIVGFTIFSLLVITIFKLGFAYLAVQSGVSFFLMLLLLTNLTGILANVVFLFSLRIPSSAINFWVTCAIIVGITCPHIVVFSSSIGVVLFVLGLICAFFWNCVCKRTLASYHFAQYGSAKDQNEAVMHITKALDYAPHDTLYRTYAVTASAMHNPEAANVHTAIMLSHYDGMCPLWSTLFHAAYVRVIDPNIYNTAVFYLKNSLRVLPEGFEPTHELLNEPNNIAFKSRILDQRRATTMREVSQEVLWKVRTLEVTKQNIKLQLENLQFKSNNVENEEQMIVNEEKAKLNVPANWVYNVDLGQFMSPEEHQNFLTKGQVSAPKKEEQKIPENAEVIEESK